MLTVKFLGPCFMYGSGPRLRLQFPSPWRWVSDCNEIRGFPLEGSVRLRWFGRCMFLLCFKGVIIEIPLVTGSKLFKQNPSERCMSDFLLESNGSPLATDWEWIIIPKPGTTGMWQPELISSDGKWRTGVKLLPLMSYRVQAGTLGMLLCRSAAHRSGGAINQADPHSKDCPIPIRESHYTRGARGMTLYIKLKKLLPYQA